MKANNNTGIFNASVLSILIAIFLLSVAIRLPNINRPLSANYEWVTAHALITNTIWQEDGIARHHFNPVYSYANPNNYNIPAPSGIQDEEGRYYYISFPPFAFIFPYLVFQTLGIDANVLPLQILNIILHFFCALILYYLINNLYNSSSNKIFVPGILGFCIYTFNPANMWYHSNVYFSDTLVQIFFIATVYCFSQFIATENKYNKNWLIGVSIFLFLTTYTEWLGVFLGFSVFIYGAWLIRSNNKAGSLLLITATMGTGLALLLTVVQYSSINGFDAFIDGILGRYAQRNGHSGHAYFYSLEGHIFLANKYLRNFFPTLLVLVSSLFVYLIFKRDKFKFKPTERALILTTLLPVIMHHGVFFEFTVQHDFSLLKSSVFLTLLIAGLYNRGERLLASLNVNIAKVSIRIFCFLLVALSIHFYYSHTIDDDINLGKSLGETINSYSNDDEVVFILSERGLGNLVYGEDPHFFTAPQLQYYARRNIKACSNMDRVLEHLKTYKRDKGIVFILEKDSITEYKRVRVTPDLDRFTPELIYESKNLPAIQN